MSDNDLEDFILNLNRDAMNHLKEENYSLALKTLHDAEKMLKTIDSNSNHKLQAITLNNFGCFYKRINKPNVALRFLKKACEKESVEPIDSVNLAGTLLNICAIYSQLGKHDLALEHGCKALQLVEKCEISSPNLASTLIIGYHNTGVEYEFLNCLKQAVECYKSAWQCAAKQLTEKNSLTQSIYKSYKEALEKLEKTELRMSVREQFRINGRVQSQESKKPASEIPTARKLPKINPYINNKSQNHNNRPKTKKRVPSISEDTIDLGQVRFLTGDRMQPMFKNISLNSSAKPRTVESKIRPFSNTLSLKKEVKPSLMIDSLNKSHKNDKKDDVILEKKETINEFIEEAINYRTGSAPVSIHVGNLQRRIKNLENRYEDFDRKVKPMKDKLPGLENFKIDKIHAAYELEKQSKIKKKEIDHKEINNKKNDEFVKFVTEFNDDYVDEENKLIEDDNAKKKDSIHKNEDNTIKENIDTENQKSINNLNEEIYINKENEDKIEDEEGVEKEEEKENEKNKDENIEIGDENIEIGDENIEIGDENIEIGDENKHEIKIKDAERMNSEKNAENDADRLLKKKSHSEIANDVGLVAAQAIFRGKLLRDELNKLNQAAIIIQKYVRKHQCRNIYINIKEAIIFIQATFRGFSLRKKLKNIQV